MGTGTEMIINTCLEQGLKAPDFEQKEDFKITFWRNVENNEDNDLSGAIGGQMDELTNRQIEVLNIIKNNPYISCNELSKQINVNESAIQKHLDNLKKKGFIEREGKTRGYWKILKN